jgi:threonine dehydrogenase-like Zn-dependent dehydrogenase
VRALTWQANEHVEVRDVADPSIQEPTDAIIRVTSTAICGSDLHLYGVLGPFLAPNDVLGHEAMGEVLEVGSGVEQIAVGDRVVIPFNISCGTCWMCSHGLFAQCETTQNRDTDTGASLFGYTSLYGSVPGGQAEYLRVPQAQFGPIKVPAEGPDDRYLFLSDILPTAYQAVDFAEVPEDGTLAVLGLGPVGQMCTRIAKQRGVGRVIGVDPVPARRALALREMVDGRGPDSVIDAVGMEAHGFDHPAGNKAAELGTKLVNALPDAVGQKIMTSGGVDRLDALVAALSGVRRGGTVSLSGVYGGAADPLSLMNMFDRAITLRMGQAHVKRWIDDLMPMVTDSNDPLGLTSFATHHLPLEDAPHGYEIFRDKQDDCLKVVLQP